MSTSINNTIACNEPHASLDVYYGPYDTIEDALEALKDVTIGGVTYHKKHVGLTIGIWNVAKTELTEYWFQGGIGSSDLVKKTNGGDFPEGIKVVTFDKNGANGTQNSVLTDELSNICLPQPTITFTGYNFDGWSYQSTTYQPGDELTITTSTVVQALWSAVTQQYTVSWTNGANVNIIGTANNVPIANGDSVDGGKTIELTAEYDTQHYNFGGWENTPEGSTGFGNTLIFTLDNNVSNITASAVAMKYMVSWELGAGISDVVGYNGNKPLVNGGEVEYGHTVKLVPTVELGYTFYEWENAPQGALVQPDNSLVFTATEKAENIKPTALSVVHLTDISWETGVGIQEIIAKDKTTGEILTSGASVDSTHTIELTAEIGQDYMFDKWVGLPASAASTENPVTFVLGVDNLNITGLTKPKHLVQWYKGEGIDTINGVMDGQPVTSPITVADMSTIKLTAIASDGYVFKKWDWEGAPEEGDYNEEENSITFTVKSDISMTAIGELSGFAYWVSENQDTPSQVNEFTVVRDNIITLDRTGIQSVYVLLPQGYTVSIATEPEPIVLSGISNCSTYPVFQGFGWIGEEDAITGDLALAYPDYQIMKGYVGEPIQSEQLKIMIDYTSQNE